MSMGESIDSGRGQQYTRAQSETLGYVLIFSMVILGSVGIVAFGATAISDTEESYSVDRAEKTLTQLDSKVGLVALEGADRQEVALPQADDGRYTVDEGTGWMNITYAAPGNETENVTTIQNVRLGEITYHGNKDRKVAYQGGGVWRAEPDGYSMMVSPPEFHYRGTTLTLPMISVTGDERLRDRATVSHYQTNKTFPNPDADESFVNPLEGGEVKVTVQSEYYQGWGQYFEERTSGSVSYNHDSNEVTVNLVVPFDEIYGHSLGTGSKDGFRGLEGNQEDNLPEDAVQGLPLRSIDDRIDNQIESCEDGECESGNTEITQSGTYFFTDLEEDPEITINVTNGDVNLVIDGDIDPEEIVVSGMDENNSVNMYVKGEFALGGDAEINKDGNPGDLAVLLHSDGSVNNYGTADFYGLLYAPQSTCNLKGNIEVSGALLCDVIEFDGAPSQDWSYDEAIENIDIEGQVSLITFLHVSHNTVTVTSN